MKDPDQAELDGVFFLGRDLGSTSERCAAPLWW